MEEAPIQLSQVGSINYLRVGMESLRAEPGELLAMSFLGAQSSKPRQPPTNKNVPRCLCPRIASSRLFGLSENPLLQ